MNDNEYPLNVLKECNYSKETLDRCRNNCDLLLLFELALVLYTTPKEASAVRLHDRDGQSYNEIAVNNNITPHTVQCVRHKALVKIAGYDFKTLVTHGIYSFLYDIETKSREEGYKKGFEKGRKEGFNDALKLLKEGRLTEEGIVLDKEYILCSEDIFQLRTVNALRRNFGSLTLKNLSEIPPEDLLQTRNFGETSYIEVVKTLEKYGYNIDEHKKFYFKKFSKRLKENDYER